MLNDRAFTIEAAGAHITREVCLSPTVTLPYRLPVFQAFLDTAISSSDKQTIPRSETTIALDAKLLTIKCFLITRQHPPELSNEERSTFVNHATQYFVLDRNLWHCEHHGKHQLILAPPRHYNILKQAHNDLGHKGVYVVHVRLILRFWWPSMMDDIKWYAHTCHECQIRQTRKLHIPPMVPMPGGLFR